MQTPISFCLDLILDCKTIEEAHKRCRKYIRELESQGLPKVSKTIHGAQQAPSTTKLLEDAPPVGVGQMLNVKPVQIDTGNGIKGVRKW